MNTMTKETCRLLAAELTAAMKAIGDKHGLDVKTGGGSYDPMSFRPKVEFKVRETAEGKSAEQVEFEREARYFGLAPEDYGKQIMSGGRPFKLVGFKPRSTKLPILAASIPDGRRYKVGPSVVNQIRPGAYDPASGFKYYEGGDDRSKVGA